MRLCLQPTSSAQEELLGLLLPAAVPPVMDKVHVIFSLCPAIRSLDVCESLRLLLPAAVPPVKDKVNGIFYM